MATDTFMPRSNLATSGSGADARISSGSSSGNWWDSIPWGSVIGGAAGYTGAGPDTTSQTNSVSPEFRPLAITAAQRGMDIGAMPYQPYEGNRVAGFTPDQFAAMDLTRNWATNNPLPGQASNYLGGMLQNGGAMAPQAPNPYMGGSATVGSNAWEGKTTNVGTNPYAGANPYLEQNIQQTLNDMTRSYNQNVAPTMAATGYKSGSFGNTGQQEMENESRNMLQRNLGSTSANMRMQDYGMQQGLSEADITRRMNAQLQDYARSGSYAEGAANRATTASMADLARNANIYESGANRYSSDWNAAQNRGLTGLSMAPSVYGMGFTGANALGNSGAAQQGQAQNVLGSQYQDWLSAQQWPFQTGNYMNNVINGGGAGGTQTTTSPGTNPWAGMIGGGLLGSQLWNYPRP